MNLDDQEIYRGLKAALDKHRSLKSNLLIVTLPGMGASFWLKHYAEKEVGVKYLVDENEELVEFNLVDCGLNGERLLKRASNNQKFAIVTEDPSSIGDKENYVMGHVYEYYYLGAVGKEDCKKAALYYNDKLTEAELQKIYEQSGGVGKLVKYLAVNKVLGDEVTRLVEKLMVMVRKSDEKTLEKLGVKKDGKLVSLILANWKGDSGIEIKINFDLSFEEMGKKAKERLTKEEKMILEYMVDNEGEIAREKVADFKWGEGKYDEFSDAAINRSMGRLGDKLEKYEIRTIPKVGYKIYQK